MKLKYLSFIAVFGFIIHSCIKHEVIPAPEQKANLKAYFNGTIVTSSNGNPVSSNVEYTENVNGYSGTANKSQVILPGGQASSVSYLFTIQSSQGNFISKIQIGLGSITWDQANSTGPTTTQFNSFFNTNTAPDYSDLAVDGFMVNYTDNSGNSWKSKETSPNSQSVNFTNVSQESDPNGDYSKYTCTFSCWVYKPSTINIGEEDSILIQNAQLIGWFQK